jgi:hypothetical protein
MQAGFTLRGLDSLPTGRMPRPGADNRDVGSQASVAVCDEGMSTETVTSRAGSRPRRGDGLGASVGEVDKVDYELCIPT